jgi:16S rRNA (cytosine1402-N4)-methyltransferase
MQHIPILVDTFLSFFSEKKVHTFVDGTLGAGGHAKALLDSHPEIENFYGVDQDPLALGIAAGTLSPYLNKITLIQGNFRFLKDLLPAIKVDGIFLDLGVSSMQLDLPEKGFSLYKEGPLDMRMDPENPWSAERVVNTLPESELGRIFCELGEEPRWRAAAKAIVEGRKKRKIKTTTDLTDILRPVLTWGGRRGKKIHPMTLIFQAIRIFVNDELGAIQEGLPLAIDLLAPGGRLGVLTFHSLEDRIVKHIFRAFAAEKKGLILTKKPLIAGREEIRFNPRSRSAKLRFIEKTCV